MGYATVADREYATSFARWVIACILILFFPDCKMRVSPAREPDVPVSSSWLPRFDFDAASFSRPAPSFCPFTRWWWPGNDVKKEELQREIDLFSDNDFGGVEIQPLNFGIPPISREAMARVLSWDTPDYYEHVREVMEEARNRHLIVDITDGSGWPAGGPFLSEEDGFLNLEFASQDIQGGGDIIMPVPGSGSTKRSRSSLEVVLATKTLTREPSDSAKPVPLDPSSTRVLGNQVLRDSLRWAAPAGNWKIIAFWSRPSGEKGMTATPKQGPVLNHFDSLAVIKNYAHLFGARTGLLPYFGNPLRAIFNDSYEFEEDRHYTPGFLTYFKEKRGYDIRPWLPANMQKGYDYAAYKNPYARPDFTFSKEDWRLQYDYDLTLSELLGEHFLKISKSWTEERGLLHRTQVYGLNMDMIGNAGLASIPETESMVGPEANLKVMTSGAQLYNRPVVSAESVVFMDRAYMTTPQKIRLAVNKLFAAGVNQIIFHGIPYRYLPQETGPEGWYPFCTPSLGTLDFSSNLGEGNTFWKCQKEINQYISRTQYALRSGKPHTDVLIYYPFMNLDGMPDNPVEMLTAGNLDDVEPPFPDRNPFKTEKGNWARRIYILINQLEAQGITWGWVNDASLQEARMTPDKKIAIRGNQYEALVLPSGSIIQLKTAERINNLARTGMKFLAVGNLPERQPSFLHWQENDQLMRTQLTAALKHKNSYYSKQETGMLDWIQQIPAAVKFNGHFSFTRQAVRDMADGSRLQFIWNQSDQWQTISCTMNEKFSYAYWLNAEDGTITEGKNQRAFYQIAPFSSVILYASVSKKIPDNLLSAPQPRADRTRILLQLDKWDIKTVSAEATQSPLFDWRTKDQFKFSSTAGIYTSSFEWPGNNTGSRYFLDLGKACFTATVYINGMPAGHRLYEPYMLNITSFLRTGTNLVEVRVLPAQLNGFIGRSQEDKRYSQFKGRENQLMAAGLLGPVYIRPEEQDR